MIPAPRTPADDAAPEADPQRDRALAEAARAGDRDAMAELYRLHNPEVLAFIRHRTRGLGITEDIAADTWLRVCRHIDTFDGWSGSGFAGWVITIARHRIADFFKSSRFQRDRSIGDMFEPEHEWLSLRGARWLEDEILRRARAAELTAAVDDLNDHQRACIRARFLDQLSVAETAERLGIAEGAVKSLTARAVRTLARDPRLAPERTA